MITNSYKGIFSPKNISKYNGRNVFNIIYRSSYELKFMMWCDTNDSVINWSSEQIVIPYLSPVDGKMHRYYVDFLVKVKTKDEKIVTYLIEVKPFFQTLEPKIQKRKTKKYLNEVFTYAINKSKWKAATKYCKERNWTFKIMTEHELGIVK